MKYELKEEAGFTYIETGGKGDTLLLLHGLFGALSNFKGIIEHFGEEYNVVVPILPIFELPIIKVSVSGLVGHVAKFVKHKGYGQMHVLGNSLGGHISLLFVLEHPEYVKTVSLTGSSGLFENSLGSSFPKRGDKEFVRNKTEATFYDPKVATDELVDEVYEIVTNRNKAIRIVATAKSALRHNLSDKLHQIEQPALLIWGKHDNVTPPFVGEKFEELLPNAELHLVDKCGHAPMMERPEVFNAILEEFLARHSHLSEESV